MRCEKRKGEKYLSMNLYCALLIQILQFCERLCDVIAVVEPNLW